MNRQLRFEILRRFDRQGDFAKQLRISESKVSRVIRGRQALSAEEEREWARVLEADHQQLFEME